MTAARGRDTNTRACSVSVCSYSTVVLRGELIVRQVFLEVTSTTMSYTDTCDAIDLVA